MKLTTSQRDRIVETYDQVGSIRETQKLLGHGANTIHRVLKAAGLELSKNCFSEDVERAIVERYNGGESFLKLSEEYGCSLKTIGNIVRRHGGDVRNRGNRFKEMSEGERDYFVQRWRAGESRTKIRKELGISHSALNRWMIQIGEKPLNRGAKGEKHGNWKGGRVAGQYGYMWAHVSREDPLFVMANASGYVAEHRLVMSRHLGRSLLKSESVHHIDGDRTHNVIENLQLRIGQHGQGQVYECAECGSRKINPVELD